MTEHNNDKSFNDGISPEGYKFAFDDIPKDEVPEWKPWHKPRKQWLRCNQWNKEIKDLIRNLRLTERPLSYLSLPGDDLLDFRLIAEFCQEISLNVKLIGFNDLTFGETTKRDFDVALNELRSSDFVHDNSIVHFDDFNDISDIESIAYQFADEKGPYDIINLDLCDSFSGSSSPYYKAALNLFKLQINKRSEPWVFLLTTRSDRAKVNLDDFKKFWQNICKNVNQSEAFKKNLEEHYLADELDNIGDLTGYLDKMPSPNFEKFFGLCIGKWLLGVINTSGQWTVKLLDSYWYRTNSATNGSPNMLSLAFLFEPININLKDPTGLAQTEIPSKPVVDEITQAVEMLTKMNQLCDIDLHLHQNSDQFEESVVSSISLLKKAGYNIASYKDWSTSNLPNLIP